MEHLKNFKWNAQLSTLALFSTSTNHPIMLYEFGFGNKINILIPGESKSKFKPYCTEIRRLLGSKRCKDDQEKRFQEFLKSGKDGHLSLCHAGVWNQLIKVEKENETKAVFNIGEILLDDVKEEALNRRDMFLKNSQLSDDIVKNLKKIYDNQKMISIEKLNEFKDQIPFLENWYFSHIKLGHRIRRESEKISHELHTRIQPILAQAENLFNLSNSMTIAEVKDRSRRILLSTLALKTVVNNLAQETYLGNYRFRRIDNFRSIIDESIEIYLPEANKKNIDIIFNFKRPKWPIELSIDHIKMALNNVINNAIKYSFYGNKELNRYIKIHTDTKEDYYQISVQNYGVGVLEEELKSRSLFKDGYQGKLTKHEFRTGSGKGLFFTKQIIDHHHGVVKIISEKVSSRIENQGAPYLTTITIQLPYLQPSGEENEQV